MARDLKITGDPAAEPILFQCCDVERRRQPMEIQAGDVAASVELRYAIAKLDMRHGATADRRVLDHGRIERQHDGDRRR